MTKEKSFSAVLQRVLVIHAGRTTPNKVLGEPFVQEVVESLRNSGYGNAVDNPQGYPYGDGYPYGVGSRGFTADAGVGEFVIGFSIFLGTSVGSWAVGKICDDLWAQKIAPALRNMAAKYKRRFEKKENAIDVIFRLEVYYGHDDLKVVVYSKSSSTASIESLERLVPEAEKRALAWVAEKGITSKVIRFNIVEGELSPNPRLD